MAGDDVAVLPDERERIEGTDRLAVDLVVACTRFQRAVSQTLGPDEPVAVWRALAILEQFGPLRVGDFAAIDRCSQPTATIMLRRLADEGAVARASDPADRRASMVSLTEEGRQRLRELRRTLIGRYGPALAELTEAEQAGLAAALPLIARVMGRAVRGG